jgi:hypothetical protein
VEFLLVFERFYACVSPSRSSNKPRGKCAATVSHAGLCTVFIMDPPTHLHTAHRSFWLYFLILKNRGTLITWSLSFRSISPPPDLLALRRVLQHLIDFCVALSPPPFFVLYSVHVLSQGSKRLVLQRTYRVRYECKFETARYVTVSEPLLEYSFTIKHLHPHPLGFLYFLYKMFPGQTFVHIFSIPS